MQRGWNRARNCHWACFSNSRSLATLMAIRRALSRVRSLAADPRPVPTQSSDHSVTAITFKLHGVRYVQRQRPNPGGIPIPPTPDAARITEPTS